MPATNFFSERSASALQRIKTYLRIIMTQPRFKNVIVIHVHIHHIDSINHLHEFSSVNVAKFGISDVFETNFAANICGVIL